MRRPFKANPPAEKAPAPIVPQDNKRTFDARPKPGDDRRREDPRYRPAAHIDPVLDDPAAETVSEEE
jgi:hypothetical protein